MSHVGMLRVERFPQVTTPCQYTDVEELGWFALTNQYEDPDSKEYIADKDRLTLRQLSEQWHALCDFDLDDRWPFFERYAQAFPMGDSKPLFPMRSWVQENMKTFNDFSPNIVSSGGHLKHVMEIPNTVLRDTAKNPETERLNYVACKRNGIIYLARKQFGDSVSASKKMYRMHRFEELVTQTLDATKDNPALGMTSFEYPYSVFGRTIGRTRLLYTQKIDCVDPHIGSSPSRYMNLSIVDMPQPDDRPFCSWQEQNQPRAIWTRCFLSGSSGALLGKCTSLKENGVKLTHCERIRTEDIPDKHHCPKQPHCWAHWNKERNISFLNEFLEFVQATVTADHESSIYGFLVDYSHHLKLSIEAVEWKKGSNEFEKDNILHKWGDEEAWPITKQPDFNETLQRTYERWKELKLV